MSTGAADFSGKYRAKEGVNREFTYRVCRRVTTLQGSDMYMLWEGSLNELNQVYPRWINRDPLAPQLFNNEVITESWIDAFDPYRYQWFHLPFDPREIRSDFVYC